MDYIEDFFSFLKIKRSHTYLLTVVTVLIRLKELANLPEWLEGPFTIIADFGYENRLLLLRKMCLSPT